MIKDPAALSQFGSKLAARHSTEHLLLAVDQFEELFTQCKDPGERKAFVDNLVHVAYAESTTTVLLNMRADFYDRISEYDILTDLVSQQQAYVKPMAQEDVVRVIAEPAKKGGWQFVEGLVDLIVKDVGHEPGRLPLLSHALLETWKRRRGMAMTLGGYSDVGGVESAIAQTAGSTLDKLVAQNPRFEGIARQIFLELTELGEGAENTRRIASREELQMRFEEFDLETVLEALVAARLITVDRDEVEVAHEALIRSWPTLEEWLEDDRERLRFERQLARDAERWQQLVRDNDLLYRGARLAQAIELVDSEQVLMTDLTAEYLAAGRELAERQVREREEHRQRQLEDAQKLAAEAQAREKAEIEARKAAEDMRLAEEKARQQAEADAANLRRRAVYLAGALVIAALLAMAAFIFYQDATQNAQEAEENLLQAQVNEAQAITAQSKAETESLRAIAAEAAAERQAQVSKAQALSTLALSQIDGEGQNDELALLLTLEAARLDRSSGGSAAHVVDKALRAILSQPRDAFGETHLLDTPFVDGGVISTGGSRAVIRSLGRLVHIMDFSQPITERVFTRGPSETTRETAISPDGNKLAATSGQQIMLWDLSSPDEPPLVWSEAEQSPTALTFAPDGKSLAGSSSKGKVWLWDEASRNTVYLEESSIEGRIDEIVYLSNGNTLATIGDYLVLRDLTDGGSITNQWAIDSIDVDALAVAPNGEFFATGADELIHLWDLPAESTAPRLAATFEGPTRALAISNDSTLVASGGGDSIVYVWDIREPQATPRILEGNEGSIVSLSFTEGIKTLSALSSDPYGEDNKLRRWHLDDSGAAPLVLKNPTDDALPLDFADDVLAAGTIDDPDSNNHVSLWNPRTTNEVPTELTKQEDWLHSTAFSPNGQLLATEGDDSKIRIWELADLSEPLRILDGRAIHSKSMVFSTEGNHLAIIDDSSVTIWDVNNPEIEAKVLGGDVSSVTFSGVGTMLAGEASGGGILLWDLTSNDPHARKLPGYEQFSTSIVFAPVPGSTVLAAGGLGPDIYLWDMTEDAGPIAVLKGHRDYVRSLAFSPDGQNLISGSRDKTSLLWDLTNPEAQPRKLEGHEDWVNAVSFTEDGRQVATASTDGTIRIWLPWIDQLTEIGCDYMKRNLSLEEWQQYFAKEEPYRCTCGNLPAHPTVIEAVTEGKASISLYTNCDKDRVSP